MTDNKTVTTLLNKDFQSILSNKQIISNQ